MNVSPNESIRNETDSSSGHSSGGSTRSTTPTPSISPKSTPTISPISTPILSSPTSIKSPKPTSSILPIPTPTTLPRTTPKSEILPETTPISKLSPKATPLKPLKETPITSLKSTSKMSPKTTPTLKLSPTTTPTLEIPLKSTPINSPKPPLTLKSIISPKPAPRSRRADLRPTIELKLRAAVTAPVTSSQATAKPGTSTSVQNRSTPQSAAAQQQAFSSSGLQPVFTTFCGSLRMYPAKKSV
ncbi:mucin-2-like [Microplitis mediator]|uniref:mucin-2-like n=1 Tax=Microplitis mediator TaxID=375433 RepID=UPI0025535FBC|nr:mucin-2-like [Microplitis mediator]